MEIRNSLLVLIGAGVAVWSMTVVGAQVPARGRGAGRATPEGLRVQTDLLHVMRGILFPASNVVFAAQSVDPATIKPEVDAASSPNPLTSTYGQWTAVENAGFALSEAANLLIIPGRKCSNGRPVPLENADWRTFVQELRDAGMAASKAAQSKNQDAILDAAGVVSDACSHCHDKYREVKVRC